LTKEGDLHDLPNLGDIRESAEGLLAPEGRENPMRVRPGEAPEMEEDEYRDLVVDLTSEIRDQTLSLGEDQTEAQRAKLARRVREIRKSVLMGEMYGGFLRENPPAENARVNPARDYSEIIDEAPEDQEISMRGYRALTEKTFDLMQDELLARAESLSPLERGYLGERLKDTREAVMPETRANPEEEEEEKPWWVDDGPENPDRFMSQDKAENRGQLLGCGAEFHEHEEGGETFYMPCSTHEEWEEAREEEQKEAKARANPEPNFHVAKVRDSEGYETYRRVDDPDSFDRGIQVLYGIRPESEAGEEGGLTELVNLYYPADEWNSANARRHADDSFEVSRFEPATGENRSNPNGALMEGARSKIARVTERTEAGKTETVEDIAHKAAANEGGEMVGKSSPESGSTVDRFYRFPSADAAESFASAFNETAEESEMGDAAVAAQMGEVKVQARDNPASKSLGAVVRVGVNMNGIPEEVPTPLTMVDEVAGANDADISGVRQSEDGSVKDFLVEAPTNEKARTFMDEMNSRATSEGIANALTTTFQHEAEARGNPPSKAPGAVVRVGVNTADIPEEVPTPLTMVDEVAGANDADISGVRQSDDGSVKDFLVEAPTNEKARTFMDEMNSRATSEGIANALTTTFQHEAEPRDNPKPATTVVARYPSGNESAKTSLKSAASEAGGTVTRTGQTTGSAYTGMEMAEVRFNGPDAAFEGVGEIESALRAEGLGEFEVTTTGTESVPPVRPNPLFPSGGGSELTVQEEAPSGPGESLVSMDSFSTSGKLLHRAREMGREAGEEAGLPDYENEEEAFRYAVDHLPSTGLFEEVDLTSAEGLDALEEAASVWTNAYGEATTAGWPRLNPNLSDGQNTARSQGINGSRPARRNPEGKKGLRESISYVGLTAILIGGGVFVADSVLKERADNAPATAILNS
jgi:hypothetical protein